MPPAPVFGKLRDMILTLRTATLSDPGLVRTNNEDGAHASDRLIAVADGIGGLPAGEVASEITIRALATVEWAPEESDPTTVLTDAVASANRQIRAAIEAEPGREGMGTTVTAALLRAGQLTLVHAGDSRAYLLREGALVRLTRDDTFVQALVDQGVVSPEDARRHPQRSLVTRVLQGAEVAPTVSTVPVAVGDRLLLCSDGLSDVVPDPTIAQTLAGYPQPGECAEQLVKLAHQAGAPDNVTVVIADVVPAAPPEPPTG